MKIDKRIRVIVYFPLFVGMLSLAHNLYPVSLLFLALLAISTYFDLVLEKNISGTVLTVIGILGAILSILFIVRMPFEAIAYLIMFLSIIKMLGHKSMRDLKQIIALSFFNFLNSAIFHYSFVFIIYLIFYILTATLALLVITYIEERKENTLKPEIAKNLSLFGVRFGIITIILSLFFFVILPRSPYVLMRTQIYSTSVREGFDNELEIGEVEDMNARAQILLRIKPEMKAKEDILYVRGIVYNKYEGNTWVREPEDIGGWKLSEEGRTHRNLKPYTISMEPMRTKVFYAPNYPENIDVRRVALSPSWGKIFMLKDPLTLRKMQYKAFSSPDPDTEINAAVDYMSIPEELVPSIDVITTALNLKALSPPEIAAELRAYFYRNYSYSIDASPDSNWLITFLQKKQGHCEYFATLTAMILRNFGVPSRIVAGFLTDEWNNFGEYFTVRTKHAHTWVEYYYEGKWVSIDPTPPRAKGQQFLANLQAYVDYLSYLWTTRVLEFSFTEQIRIFSNIRNFFRNLTVKDLVTIVTYAIILLGLVATGILIKRKISKREHIATRYFRNFQKAIKRQEIKVDPGTTTYEISQIVNSEEAKEFLQEYLQCRFSNNCNIDKLKRKFLAFKKSIS